MNLVPYCLPEMNLNEIPPRWPVDIEARASAVLALFMQHPTLGLSILFTRRASQLRSHAGQVGFPGGRRERCDIGPAATALRETYEEIGLAPDSITVLGSLRPLKSMDSHPVLPLVAYTDKILQELSPNADEVAEIFLVPWLELTTRHRSIVRFNIFGRWRETPYYEACGQHIWGLTAWMIDGMALVEPSR